MYLIGKEEIEAVTRVIESKYLFRYKNAGDIGHNNEVNKFEKELSDYFDIDYAICTTSGTAALICALAGAGIGPGEEVIIPGYTYIATPLAVLSIGAIPVIVDIDESCTIDINAIRSNITKRTRAIIPVHMMGMPCNIEIITKLAKEKNVLVIEDACQADGGSYKGKKLGTWGNVGTLSFNYYKIISSGEGGAVITNDTNIYERAYIKHDGGCYLRPQVTRSNNTIFAGENYRSNEIIASILRVQLTRLPKILSRLREIKKTIIENIQETKKVRLVKSYDPEGDCGIQTLLHTDSEKTTYKLIEFLEDKLIVNTPIDSDRHVYSNWEPVINKNGGHHIKMDPFKMDANKESNIKYSENMLPNTTKILKQSVMIHHDINWQDKDLKKVIELINKSINML